MKTAADLAQRQMLTKRDWPPILVASCFERERARVWPTRFDELKLAAVREADSVWPRTCSLCCGRTLGTRRECASRYCSCWLLLLFQFYFCATNSNQRCAQSEASQPTRTRSSDIWLQANVTQEPRRVMDAPLKIEASERPNGDDQLWAQVCQSTAATTASKMQDDAEDELVRRSETRQESRCGRLAFGVKSRKSNKMFQATRLGSDLISCLAEFLASRNVINQTERYEKIRDNKSPAARQRRARTRDKIPGWFESSHSQNKWPLRAHEPSQASTTDWYQPSGAGWQRADRVKKFDQAGQLRKDAKHGIGRLLGDLLSGRHGNRLVPLVRLLRAPVVLAALFSFALAVSLFTLYTLSFHHCQTRYDQVGARQPRVMRADGGNISETGVGVTTFVQTECGHYEGTPEGRALKFRGVAYASAPVGSRRWQRPRPVWLDDELCARGSSWPEQAAREHCVQLSPFNHRVSGSEDCLYLDIYTPARLGEAGAKSVQRLPVMVYIHGGFLVFGSNGAEPQADQANWMRARPSGQLAAELNVVLVAPNYRLQALGFMALKQLALDNGPDGSEGNYGLWDQLVALQWIRRNIDSFGGDPNNVLLFGPDSASALPLALVSRKQPTGRNDDDDAGHSTSSIDSATHLKPEASRENNPNDDDYEQLFHSVWLMNPTIYYELPFELANQHYSRLIKSQSVCSGDRAATGGVALQPAGNEQSANHTSRYASRLAEWHEARRFTNRTGSNSTAERLLDCLMGLSGEQLVREYLGRDDAAFRLDDENSLPIRNIFPDQFVTLDGQLVRDSFPFLRSASAPDRQKGNKDEHKASFLIGSTAQAVEFWPCPRNVRDWSWADFRHYVATSLNSFNQADTFERAAQLYQVAPVDCVGGQASCSKATSRNSPTETYLTMVSDIRQVCPAHELSRSLRQSGRLDSLERYIVEWRPSGKLSRSMASNESDGRPNQLEYAFHNWDLLALFGFEFDARLEPDATDLEFQRQVRAMAKRVAWSRRSNESTDALNHKQADSLRSSAGNGSGQLTTPSSADDSSEPSERFTIFTLDNQVRSGPNVDAGGPYKSRECKMWQQSLKQSYAWIS